jgi:hypothetical protein
MTEDLEQLKTEYAGQCVVVDAQRPELARFADKRGRVKTINANGRALVQFEGPDPVWYDIHPDFLRIVKEPAS